MGGSSSNLYAQGSGSKGGEQTAIEAQTAIESTKASDLNASFVQFQIELGQYVRELQGLRAEHQTLSDEFHRQKKLQASEANEIKNELDKAQTRVVETLAVFVALFTFVSIDFQVFKLNDGYRSLGLILAFAGLLLLFLLALSIILHRDEKAGQPTKTLLFVASFLVIAGVYITGNTPPEDTSQKSANNPATASPRTADPSIKPAISDLPLPAKTN
jgi:hypothetical protein